MRNDDFVAAHVASLKLDLERQQAVLKAFGRGMQTGATQLGDETDADIANTLRTIAELDDLTTQIETPNA